MYVNGAQAWRYQPERGYSSRNCAACTAAGAVNLTIGRSEISSGMVAATRKMADCDISMGEDVGQQIENIAAYVKDKTRRKCLRSPAGETARDAVESWMKTQPDGTVFAVDAFGHVTAAGKTIGHWLNAILAGGKLRYFDFQPMREGSGTAFVGAKNPATSTAPFVGVVTQTRSDATTHNMHATVQAGSFDDGVELIALAFPPD